MASMSKDKIKDLKFNMVLARKRAMPFGLCLGKSPESSVLIFHKTQPPKKLGLAAKKDGETPKFTYGTMTCEGKNLLVSCQGDILAGLARKLKLFFKSANINMKIQILDPSGTMLEEDGDADEDAPLEDDQASAGGAVGDDPVGDAGKGDAAAGDDAGDGDSGDGDGGEDDSGDGDGAAPDDPMAAQWEAEKARVEALVQQFLQGGDDDSGEILDLWAKAIDAAGNGVATAAMKLAAETEALIRAATQAREFMAADLKKWNEASDRIRAHVEKAMEGDAPIARKIRGLWTLALAKAEGDKPDIGAALKAIPMLVKLLKEAASATSAVADGKKWGEVYERIRPHIEEALENDTPLTKKIRALWSLALAKAEGDKPDFAAALKAVPMLIKLVKEADAAAAAGGVGQQGAPKDTGAADAEPAMAGAAGDSGGRGGGRGGSGPKPPASDAPAAAGDPAPDAGPADAAGDPAPDAGAPDAAGDPVPGAGAPDGGAPAAGPADAAGDAAGDAAPAADEPAAADAPPAVAANLSGDDAAKLARIDTSLKAANKLVGAYMALIPGSAEPKPPAWVAETTRLKTDLTAMQAAGAVLETAKLDKALKDLAKLTNLINTKTAEKKNWKKALDLFNIRLLTLDHHVQSTEPEILPKMTDIKTRLAAAETKANGQDFKGAIKALGPLTTRCDEVELLADGCAHYKAVLGSRTALVAGIAGTPATGVADIDTMKAKITTLLADAATDAAGDKFDDAVKKLDKIPPLHTRYLALAEKKREYDRYITHIDPLFALIATLPAPQQAVLEPALAAFKKAYADAKIAKTNDYVESAGLMQLLWMKEVMYFKAKEKAVRAYFPAKKDFDDQMAIFKPHAGRPGIEAFYLEMEADGKKADIEIKVNRFSTATGLLNRSKANWPKEQKRADDYVAYNAALTSLKPIMDGLRPKPAAANGLAQADALIATAAKQALAREYGNALASIIEAEIRAAEAKDAADAADALGALKDDTALADIASDFAAAYKVFTDMRANVAGKDSTGTFAAEIAKADIPADAAKAASSATPPEYELAGIQLGVAIGHLEDTLPKIMAYVPWKTRHTAAKTMVDLTLAGPGVNADNCIQGLIDDAKALVTDSANLAAAPGLDIAGAEARLTEAQVIIDTAAADGALYPQVKADVAKITAQKVALALPANSAVAPFMATRVARINKYLTDIAADITAKKMKAAAKKAAEGAALSGATQWDITTGTNAIAVKTGYYDVEHAKVAGKPPCAKLVTSAEALATLYTKSMAVPNFDAAQKQISSGYWELKAAGAVLAQSVTFEPKRNAAKAELDKAKAVRNPGVEAELKALETRYTEALKLGPAGNYHRATIEVDEILAASKELVKKANDYKPYEDARIIAKPKLDAALAHPQADAIKPMLTRLSAKYAAAEKLAGEGEYTAAKTMMTEIATDADAAIESADRCATFEKLTGALDLAADTGILPAAVIATTQEVLDRLNKRPEAASAKADLTEAATQLAAARAGGGGAKAALKAAIAACEKADETMSQFRMLQQSVGRALTKIAELKAHAQAAYIAPLLKSVDTAVNGVLPKALASGAHVAEAAALDGHFSRMLSLVALADDYAKYLTTRVEPAVEPKVAELERHDHRYAIKDSIDAMRSKLVQAAEMAKTHLMEDALKRLEEVRALGLSAQVMADMRANTPPSVKDIKAILASPGGQAQLDAMIDNLEPDAQRKVLRVAFEARFGCTLKKFVATVNAAGKKVDTIQLDANRAGPNIKRFYELMSDLPPSDTTDNDSLLIFSDREVKGSSFSQSKKEIIMNEGHDATSGAYGFGRDFEVGGKDPDCQPVDMEPVTRFSWNTLHEVGHAVDDKHGYMNKNGGAVDHGSWKEYGSNYGPVAEVFAKKYDYDKKYVEQYMLHNPQVAIPEIPTGGGACSPEEWERRRVAVTSHIKLAQIASKPWNSNAQAAQIAIGGMVYQESYSKTWISYKLDAREKGMTGYQFRAPGEWFAELYAAYHIGKMKPSHPAVKWLEKLK